MRRLVFLPLALLLFGCPAAPVQPSSSSTPVPASPSPSATPAPAGEGHNSNAAEQTACGLLQGPASELRAGTKDEAPEIGAEAKRYAVVLPGNGSDRLGLLRFKSPKTSEWSFFLDRDVYVIVRDARGQVVPGAKLKGSAYCGELAVQRVYELEAGTYTLDFGPSAEERFSLVIGETHPGGAGMGAH